MMSLLLCFFVILVAISEVKEEKFHKVMESIREYLGWEDAPRVEPGDNSGSSFREQISRVMNEQGSPDDQGAPVKSTLGQHVLVQTVEEGHKITLGGKILFEEGSAELLVSAYPPLDRLISILKGYPNKLEVRGHTGIEQLPPGSTHRDLFDLAFERARAAADYLKDEGVDPRRIRLYSGGPFDRPESNLTYEGQESNRSVEIIVSEELIAPEGAEALL
jgi:chemotaxis protein MotB